MHEDTLLYLTLPWAQHWHRQKKIGAGICKAKEIGTGTLIWLYFTLLYLGRNTGISKGKNKKKVVQASAR
jgi:hypothetical protein